MKISYTKQLSTRGGHVKLHAGSEVHEAWQDRRGKVFLLCSGDVNNPCMEERGYQIVRVGKREECYGMLLNRIPDFDYGGGDREDVCVWVTDPFQRIA